MATNRLLNRAVEKLGFDRDQADRAVAAVLTALGRQLDTVHAEIVSRQLAPAYAALLRCDNDTDTGPEAVFEHVALTLGTAPGATRETVIAVCQALACVVDDEGLQHLRADVDPAVAAWFEPVRRGPRAVEPDVWAVAFREHTLAGGRPGATHTLGDARPVTPGHLDDDNPHWDRKLSSAGALGMQPRGTTLADGAPRSGRPVDTEG